MSEEALDLAPLDLLDEILTEHELDQVEARVRSVPDLPEIIMLGDLRSLDYGNDPSELIKCRFFYKKGILLIIGPTGVGKSSFVMMFMIHLSVGRALFGMEVGEVYQINGMRILYIQAENDEGDLAEMRNGTIIGCEDLSDEEKIKAIQNIFTVTLNDRTGPQFAETLERLLIEKGPFDLVVVDPAYAYIAGDSNSNKDVSDFVRKQITPILHRQNVGMILVHHSAKPPRGKEKEGWAAGDYAYLGSGAAEWVNPARAALAIRSLGSDSVYELRSAKRGRRLGWSDPDGLPTTVQTIAHHGAFGVICWRYATESEIATVRPPSARKLNVAPPNEILNLIVLHPNHNQTWYCRQAALKFGCTSNTIQNRIQQLEIAKLIEARTRGRDKTYRPSQRGKDALEDFHPEVQWDQLLGDTP